MGLSFWTSAMVRTGLWITGPSPLANSSPMPMGSRGEQDVGENDGRIDLVAAHRLDRHLGRKLRRLAHLKEAALRPDLAVLLANTCPPGRIIHTGVQSTRSLLHAFYKPVRSGH